jgi:hypothetical protein
LFTLASLQRQGRVFLADDAGHVRSPTGGQGMNPGIGESRPMNAAGTTCSNRRLIFGHRFSPPMGSDNSVQTGTA